MLKKFGLFFWGLNLLTTIILVLSCIAPKVSPETNFLMAFIGLGFPIIYLLNIGWLVFWLFVKRKYVWLPIIGFVIGLPNAGNYASYRFFKQVSGNQPNDISILSYNVKLFDLYNWSNNVASQQGIMNAINKADVDVLCIQEFYTENSPNFNTKKQLLSKYRYAYFQPTLSKENNKQWGIATFSKYPIIKKEKISFDNAKHNLAISTLMVIKGDTVNVINVHFQSLHFGYGDYGNIGSPDFDVTNGLFSTVKKIKAGFAKRIPQAKQLASYIASSQYPVILCGDFNDSPNSHTYQIIKEHLEDSFKKAGWGLKSTYSGKLPFLRIDYIMGTKAIHFKKHHVIEEGFSDHYPVYSTFTVAN